MSLMKRAARPRTIGMLAAAAVLATPALAAPQFGGLTAAAATAHRAAARATPSNCPKVFPLAKVHAGQRATGYTTSKGVSPQPFAVRVLGILKDGIAPGIDLIVIRTHSAQIKQHGTWEGMSGSPIYARNGRLIGALSYGISFGASNTAGVTPAAAMYRLFSDPRGAATPFARRAAVPRRMQGTAATGATRDSGLRLLPTPITVSGVPASQFGTVRKRLQKAGFGSFSLHVGGARGARHTGSTRAIRAGAPFAATFAYGDYTLGGVGTVTAVCHGQVIAFGHPLNALGATSETANAARVLYVQSDPAGPSFIMANIGHIVGTVNQDRFPGIRARLGHIAPTTNVVVHASSPATGLHRTGHTHTPLLLEAADAAAGTTFFDLISTVQSETQGSASLSWTATGHTAGGKPWKFHQAGLVTDPFDIENGVAFQIFNSLGYIAPNPFNKISVDRVTVHVSATETLNEWELTALQYEHNGTWHHVGPNTVVNVTPGTDLRVRAHLSAYQHASKVKDVLITIPIPANAGSGFGQVQVGGGADLAENGPDLSNVTNFDTLLAALRKVPSNNALVTDLSVSNAAGTSTIDHEQKTLLDRVVRGIQFLGINVV